MSGLSDLLQRLNTEGWSSRRIEREAARHGHQLSNATAAKYIRGDHPSKPGADTLQALADVFSADVGQLREAAGLPGMGEPFDLGPDASRLTGSQREVLRTTARLFIEQNDALADRAVGDGATIRELRPAAREDRDEWAANEGHRNRDEKDAAADRLGEESQDPEDWA